MSSIAAKAIAACVLVLVSACGGDRSPATGERSEDPPCDDNHIGAVHVRVRYQTAVVSAGEVCLAQDQTRTCMASGDWSSWSGAYTEETCGAGGGVDRPDAGVDEDGPADCWGDPHGTVHTRIAYEAAVPSRGEVCNSEMQTRTCTDGAWGEWSGSYRFEQCSIGGGFSCGDLQHAAEEFRFRYRADLVPSGVSCEWEQQVRTCVNGKLTPWSGTFTAAKCELEGQRHCEGGIKHTDYERRPRYEASNVPYGACKRGDQKRLCIDGKLGEWSQDFTFEECVEDPAASCTAPDGTIVPHGTVLDRTVYRAGFSETACEPAKQRGVCQNGLMTWSYLTNVDVPYQFLGCGGGPVEIDPDVGSERSSQSTSMPVCNEYRGAAKSNHQFRGSSWWEWRDGFGCPTSGTLRGTCEFTDYTAYEYGPRLRDDDADCRGRGGVWTPAATAQ